MSKEVVFQAFVVRGRKYRVYVPEGPGPHPTILFLHGAGESGLDGERQVTVGLPKFVATQERWQKFMVVCPQKGDTWALWPSYEGFLDLILADVDKRFNRDHHRTYLTGLSQGGNACFRLAGSLRWTFAAVAPICGWGNPDHMGAVFNTTPLWVFHGEADPVIPVEMSTSMVKWIARSGVQPKLTTYPGVDHNSWDRAYGEEPLDEWFLEHHLHPMPNPQ